MLANPKGLRSHYASAVTDEIIGHEVSVCGWIASVREHGEHLTFIDLRDSTGVVQCVISDRIELHPEWVIRVVGKVSKRPGGTENPTLPSGQVEISDASLEVLSKANAVPFSVSDQKDLPDESVRLRYRFVDLRRARLQRNIRTRAQINKAIRHSLESFGFLEIETPMLWTPTPEGAREFSVPSRLQPGNFYVLPQSPQIAKQLLMVSGFDRYYQIARCMRDEDLRSDRQFEFTQLDLEASFVTQEDVREFITQAVSDATQAATGQSNLAFPSITYREAIARYGSDKPDIRFGHEIFELSDLFAGSGIRALDQPSVGAFIAPAKGEFSRSKLDQLVDRAKALGAAGLLWFRIKQGTDGSLEVDSPIAKFLKNEHIAEIVTRLGAKTGDVVLAVSGEFKATRSVLGTLRTELGRANLELEGLRYLWVIDFPMFEGLDDAGNPIAAHHPFTMPNADDFELMFSDPLAVRAQSYDLVLNGWELGSGSIRIHDPKIQSDVFKALGISDEVANQRFGFLLDAFGFGAPPHGGFAFGIDRLAALLCGEDTIREVIAFPKTQSGLDLMTGAPKQIAKDTLQSYGLAISESQKKA
ncbi:MAG: aspartate--tRNA ligase [Acidimicrobiaceae bacterium]|nr:aspartate--tRNA ligase [Acidimicrobiaceae bacterium]